MSIEAEDDVQRRATFLAQLARAILPANRTEARALFTRGLAELDAIGSGDNSFTNELLWFARSLRQPLASEAAHRLAKICELNVYDSRKFPWPLASAAFSRCWGTPYLAQLSRWHDRDKVTMGLTLPATLTCLLRERLIRPDDALAMLRLVEPEPGWDWDWDQLAESIISLRPPNLEALLREDPLSVRPSGPETAACRNCRENAEAFRQLSSRCIAIIRARAFADSRHRAASGADRRRRRRPLWSRAGRERHEGGVPQAGRALGGDCRAH